MGLIIGLQHQALAAGFYKSFGGVGIGRSQCGTYILKPDAVLVEELGVDLHPYGGLVGADHIDPAYSLNTCQHGFKVGFSQIAQGGNTAGGRCKSCHHNRAVRGIGLVILGLVKQRVGHIRAGSTQGGLHITCGSVDVPVIIKKQKNKSAGICRIRAHTAYPCNLAKPPFQRSGHGTGQLLRRTAGLGGNNINNRHGNIGQIRHRHGAVCKQASHHKRNRHKGCANGAHNKQPTDRHRQGSLWLCGKKACSAVFSSVVR